MRTPPNKRLEWSWTLFVVGVAKMTTVAVVESCGLPQGWPRHSIAVFGRHVASATRVPSKRPRTSERSRIRQAGVLRPWQSEESVAPFFSSSALQWAWLCSAMQATCTHRAL